MNPLDYLDEACEDCEAPPGVFCRPNCPGAGLTAEDWRSTRKPEVPSPYEDQVPPGF